jgi:hypothetical protein
MPRALLERAGSNDANCTPARVCDGPVVDHAPHPPHARRTDACAAQGPRTSGFFRPYPARREHALTICPMSCVCNGRGLALSLSSSSVDRLLVRYIPLSPSVYIYIIKIATGNLAPSITQVAWGGLSTHGWRDDDMMLYAGSRYRAWFSCQFFFLSKCICSIFVVIWQLVSNYGLISLKRFVSSISSKLCN